MSGDLPKGWISVPLKTLLQSNSRKNIGLDDNTVIGFTLPSHFPTTYLSQIKFEEKQWKQVKGGHSTHFMDGDILLAKMTPSFENGSSGIARNLPNGHGASKTEYHVFRPKTEIINPCYLLALLKTKKFLGDGKMRMTGSLGRMRVPKNYILERKFPLPPRKEQDQIVNKLNVILESVEHCKSKLVKAETILKLFRQSTINAAISGKLTEDWRKKNGLTFNWTSSKLKEITSKIGSGATPRGGKKSYKHSGIPLIRSKNIHFDGFKEKGLAFINDNQAAKISNATVCCNDVLLNITGTIGRVTLAPVELEGGRVNDHVYIIRLAQKAKPRFIFYFFASSKTQKLIDEVSYGTNQKIITKGIIEDFEIQLPTLEEQQEIVRRAESMFTFADLASKKLTIAREHIDNIEASLLDKAVGGELVPQDTSDETASDLLERVSEKAQPKPKSEYYRELEWE